MNVNRTQDFSISLTKLLGGHTFKAGFYLNHSAATGAQAMRSMQAQIRFQF